MYNLQSNCRINFGAEVSAMAEHIGMYWEGTPDLVALFSFIREQVASAFRLDFDEGPVWDSLSARASARKALVLSLGTDEDESRLMRSYDRCYNLLTDMVVSISRLRGIAEDLDRKQGSSSHPLDVYKAVKKAFPTITKARPQGWKALAKGYTSDAGVEEYFNARKSSEEAAFKGANTQTHTSLGFVETTSLPEVMRRTDCAGSEAPVELVCAAHAHFVLLQKHENACELLESLKTLDAFESRREVIFDIEPQSENPLVAGLLKLSTSHEGFTREAFERELAAARAFRARPAAEQAAIRKTREGELKQTLGDLFRKCLTAEPKASPAELACRETKLQLSSW